MSRFRVRVSNGSPGPARPACWALVALFVLSIVSPARAQPAPNLWFAGTWLVLERSQTRGGEIAGPTDDPALARFLAHLGATLSYDPAQRYAIVTTADYRTIAFTIGDKRYAVGAVTETAPFAPYVSGGEAYLPFVALAEALYVQPVSQADATVLQPQIASLDVRNEGRVSVVTLHGAATLRFKRLSAGSDGRLSLAFLGTASTLDPYRDVAGDGLRSISISVGGSVRNPTTTVTFQAPPGGLHALMPAGAPNALAVAFAPPGVPLTGTPVPASGVASVAAAGPAPVPTASEQTTGEYAPAGANVPAAEPSTYQAPGYAAPAPPAPASAQPVQVVNFESEQADQGLNVRVWLAGGSVAYEWHRLPDNRWYIDFKNATLAVAPQDETLQNDAVLSLRLKQVTLDPYPVVRVALSLATPRLVNLVPFDGGVTIAVDRLDDLAPAKVGIGTLSAGVLAAATPTDQTVDQTPAPIVEPTPWKFTPVPVVAYAAPNPRLIVIDPGHGGSDTGAMQRGLVEKELTLDISDRLRSLLVARGWLVKMTRDSDVDVFEPNDSAHDELQARCDIANRAGARMFISVHVNSYTSGSLNGTTTYYYKGVDLSLAQAIHSRLIESLGTADRGVRKENFYVIHHTVMPATLVETAFMSNAADAQLLRSPAWRQKVAGAIADGVGDYAGAPPPKSSAPAETSDTDTPVPDR
jgi:N-acetylmuramoyl-L-alanine amidase CwlD